MDLDSLIGEDHRGAGDLGLRGRTRPERSRGSDQGARARPGHPATSPRLLLALWLYATSDGVGSARALERLCKSDDVYRWLCGGVSVNYHSLADFRVGCTDLLDRLLGEHLAALAKGGLVDLEKLAQDGVRVRANAGVARSGARRRWIASWPWRRRWSTNSSARSTRARRRAIGASRLPRSGRRASASTA